jgi:DNA-binding HxlR family transcriptional regulator
MTDARRSDCPIASTLDIVGDRWTLVIVRDLINGKKRFAEFLASPERITTSVLTTRLGMLERAGIVEKRVYQTRPRRHDYHLTESGRHLLPVLQAMCIWGNAFLKDTWVAPETFMRQKP